MGGPSLARLGSDEEPEWGHPLHWPQARQAALLALTRPRAPTRPRPWVRRSGVAGSRSSCSSVGARGSPRGLRLGLRSSAHSGPLVGLDGSNLWEIDREHPLGDHFQRPAGVAVPGGAGFTTSLPKSRRALLHRPQEVAGSSPASSISDPGRTRAGLAGSFMQSLCWAGPTVCIEAHDGNLSIRNGRGHACRGSRPV